MLSRYAFSAVFTICVSALSACNSVGPYHGSIYRIDDGLYQVGIVTWMGGWQDRTEAEKNRLKREAQLEALAGLRRLGLSNSGCMFQNISFAEGGHMTILFLAGEQSAVRQLESLSTEERKNELGRMRKNRSTDTGFVGSFDGRLGSGL
jgi:hypothetical protein